MGVDPIPPQVKTLLHRHFTSVSQVEALMVLMRSPGHRSLHELSHDLVLAEDHVELLLEPLVRTRLVRRRDGGYEFHPSNPKERAAAEELVSLYRTYRVRIMTIVISESNSELRDFAEAFRLRTARDDEGDG